MWPFCVLLSKLLGLDERYDEQPEENHLALTKSLPFRHLTKSEHYGTALLPHSHFVDVPHINQLRTWDCGLNCVLMILRTLGFNDCTIQELDRLCSLTSIWTIDLAFLLQKFDVSFSYFTVTLGVNPEYSTEIYYKEQLPDDLVRVDSLFQKAMDAGISVECRSISRQQLCLLILSGRYIAIALVNQYLLSQSSLKNWFSTFNNDNPAYTDFVLHQIEEILEDLEFPEHFHARDMIEKIDWLASAIGEIHWLPLNGIKKAVQEKDPT
ncbi:guanylyl cyclase 1-like isoform X6 [Apium graveolens]|uniref:guanylyl cyclase 1-like isoform X6 n=1 Tax=Apium graveolens TaxID=4045 RepID=UPI003D7A7529